MHSILFVPGSRSERFSNALASGAHVVCIDLEDSVANDAKSVARQSMLDFLPQAPVERLAVRINGCTTRHGLADVLALADAPRRPALILIPKVEAAAELDIVRSVLADSRVGLVPLIESAEGLARAATIASTPDCAALMFGGADLAGELGVPMSWDALLVARSSIVHACARAGVPAFDVPYLDLNDHTGLIDEARRVRMLGFAGKAAVHPRQVEAINGVFAPMAEEIAEAQAAIAAYQASGGAAVEFRGRLLEAPLVRRYERILTAAQSPAK